MVKGSHLANSLHAEKSPLLLEVNNEYDEDEGEASEVGL